MKRWIFLCSSLLVFWMASVASAELYSWKDANGNVHFADRLDAVPPEYREQVEVSNPVERRSDSWNLSQGAAPAAKPAGDEKDSPSVIALIEKVGLAKFVLYAVLGFLLSMLVQIFILKKACRLVGENEPLGLGQCGGIVLLEGVAGALPNGLLALAFHMGWIATTAAQGKMTIVLGALLVGIALQIASLRLTVTQSVTGAAQVWLGQILVTMFLSAILAGLGYLLSFCSGFMKDASVT